MNHAVNAPSSAYRYTPNFAPQAPQETGDVPLADRNVPSAASSHAYQPSPGAFTLAAPGAASMPNGDNVPWEATHNARGTSSSGGCMQGVRALFTNPRTWPRKKQIIVGVAVSLAALAVIVGAAVGASHHGESQSDRCNREPCGYGCPAYEAEECT